MKSITKIVTNSTCLALNFNIRSAHIMKSVISPGCFFGGFFAQYGNMKAYRGNMKVIILFLQSEVYFSITIKLFCTKEGTCTFYKSV